MSQIYQLAEVAEHNGKNGQSIWIIIKGNVYDVTSFVDEHPGGAELILEQAGKDATKAFNNAGHSPDASNDLKKYKIGELAAVIDTQPKPQSGAGLTKNQSQKEEQQPPEKSSSCLFCC